MDPLINYHIRNVNVQSTYSVSTLYKPIIGNITDSVRQSGFHTITCNLTVETIEYSPGLNGDNNNFECYVSDDTVVNDGSLASNLHVPNCIKYRIRYDAVCM